MAWERRRRGLAEMGPWAFLTHNLTFALLTIVAGVILVLGKSQGSMLEAARTTVQDGLTPFFEWAAGPSSAVTRWTEGLGAFFDVYAENQKLREENARLQSEAFLAIELRQKVQRYEALLNAGPQGAIPFVTGRIIADSGGAFAQTMIVNVGRDLGVSAGQAVSNEQGLIGHVIHSGYRSARVILLTDPGSRVPVRLERGNVKAILAGTNDESPALQFLPRDAVLIEGDRVITASDGGILPPGVPVGVVMGGEGEPRVKLFADKRRVDFVRVLKYAPHIDVDEAPPEALPGTPKDPKAPNLTPPMLSPAIAQPAGPALPATQIVAPVEGPGSSPERQRAQTGAPAPQTR